MLKVIIKRPEISTTITLTLDEETADGEAVDLKGFMQFLTEVARAAGFPYIADLAALTEYRVVPGTETTEFWQNRLKKQKEKADKGTVDTPKQEHV